MDEAEQNFPETQSKKPLIWLNIFFIWTHGERKLEKFLKDLNNFTPNLSFTHEASKSCIPFLDLKVKLIDGKLCLYTKRSIFITLRVNRLTGQKTIFPKSWNIMESSKRPSKCLSINFLAQKRPYFPLPKSSKQKLSIY